MRRLIVLALSVGWLAHSGSQARPSPTHDASKAIIDGAVGREMDRYLTRLAAYGFSGTVLVAKANQIWLHKGYGLADAKNGIPNTTRTVYDIASLAKQFTATAILRLENLGKLKTGDSISKYLPGVPDDKKGITLHHLLTHTSGLQFDCEGADKMNREQFIGCMLESKLTAEPGKRYSYSNAGYGLLAAIIELVSGQSYEVFLEQQLFKPAGMESTGFNGAGKWSREILAHGYDEATDRGTTQTKPLTWQMRGAWGLSASAGDLYRWEQSLRRNQVISSASTGKLFTSYVTTSAKGDGYGYGWAISKTARGTSLVEHDGITFEGHNVIYQRYVDEDVVIIVASNRFFGRYLPIQLVAPALAGIVFKSAYTLPPAFVDMDGEQLQKYAGTYDLGSGARFFVRVEDGALQIAAEGQTAINVLAAVDDARGNSLSQFNDRTLRILNGIRRNDYVPIEEAFANQMTAEAAKGLATAWLGRLEGQHGPLRTVDIVGTIPEPGIARTFARLNFEHGTEIRRFRWENGFLGNIVVGQLPLLMTTFRPQSITEFTGFHLGIARPVPIKFVIDRRGLVSGLTVRSSAGSATAGKAE